MLGIIFILRLPWSRYTNILYSAQLEEKNIFLYTITLLQNRDHDDSLHTTTTDGKKMCDSLLVLKLNNRIKLYISHSQSSAWKKKLYFAAIRRWWDDWNEYKGYILMCVDKSNNLKTVKYNRLKFKRIWNRSCSYILPHDWG